MSEFDVNEFYVASRARRLMSALDGMEALGNPRAAASIAEGAIDQLVAAAPDHPDIQAAVDAVERFRDSHPEEFAPLPALREIGQLRDICPSCGVALAKRPSRKTTCGACGCAIFVLKRPMDEQRVLANDADSAEIKKDWEVHYKLSMQQPRRPNDEWMRRIDEAAAAKEDQDPAVEAAAQNVFASLLAVCTTEAPRDAMNRLLDGIPGDEFRSRVERRVWQLQVQSMGGRR